MTELGFPLEPTPNSRFLARIITGPDFLIFSPLLSTPKVGSYAVFHKEHRFL